ncbi:MAG: sodium-translocating pyrophosphatase [Candidatus Cloacimonas sp. 4484_209]|nr:MAG: sodium-translocating pyrophosphatase [Candidatus Cloacimonas sp. 4484_209]
MIAIHISLYTSIFAIIFIFALAISILRKDKGNKLMRSISRAIQRGAQTFLKKEYFYVSIVVIVISVIFILSGFYTNIGIDWRTAISFLLGTIVSALAGYIAMWIGTRANARTTQAAFSGLKPALFVSFSAGSVTGMSIVGIGLLGFIIVYTIFKGNPLSINGYAMGASLLALFARAGGGIFTKAADMGADLVGKIEEQIPEDDPRNAAAIADNVGDNVGDTAGLGADLLESYVESIIATVAIGVSLTYIGSKLVELPLLLASTGIICSIIGILVIRLLPVKNPQNTLNAGIYISTVLMIIGSFIIIKTLNISYSEVGKKFSTLGPFWAVFSGLFSGLIIGLTSEVFTSDKFSIVKKLAKSAQSGPAIVVVNGLSVGMQSTAIPVVMIATATLVSYYFAGMYGVALAALGMLSILGITLSVDSYGPVADNAGGIAQMAGLPPNVREITDKLDAVGNTTAAIGKGFAIGSAAFAALGLITAYIATISEIRGHFILSLADPKVISGLFIGGMVPFLFSSLLASAVGKIAYKIVEEVRRQFKNIKGLLEGKAEPDTERCVHIATVGAIQSMILPGLLAIFIPVIVGLTLGPVALGGLLVGALITGLMLGIFTANTGAALDNAKKYIESGHFGGKNTEAHKASIVGDTVGDPLKDTVGPSINILIKLMSVISLVLAPIFAKIS